MTWSNIIEVMKNPPYWIFFKYPWIFYYCFLIYPHVTNITNFINITHILKRKEKKIFNCYKNYRVELKMLYYWNPKFFNETDIHLPTISKSMDWGQFNVTRDFFFFEINAHNNNSILEKKMRVMLATKPSKYQMYVPSSNIYFHKSYFSTIFSLQHKQLFSCWMSNFFL